MNRIAIIYILIFVFALVINAQVSHKLRCKSKELQTLCSGGVWQSAGDDEFAIPSNTTSLWLTNITLDLGDFEPLPTLLNITFLEFSNITNIGNVSRNILPLQRLTSQLNKTALQELSIDNISLSELEADYLEGYSELTTLYLWNVNLSRIHPRAFFSLAKNESERNSTETVMRQGITSNYKLANIFIGSTGLKWFPWEALIPISNSLQRLVFVNNIELSEMRFTNNLTAAFTMARLSKLEFIDNHIETLPDNVLSTLGSYSSTQLSFRGNRNSCSGCELMPLVRWARSVTYGSLDATCTNTSKDVFSDDYFVNLPIGFWQAHLDCDETNNVTDSPSSVAPSVTNLVSSVLPLSATTSANSAGPNVTNSPSNVALNITNLLSSVLPNASISPSSVSTTAPSWTLSPTSEPGYSFLCGLKGGLEIPADLLGVDLTLHDLITSCNLTNTTWMTEAPQQTLRGCRALQRKHLDASSTASHINVAVLTALFGGIVQSNYSQTNRTGNVTLGLMNDTLGVYDCIHSLVRSGKSRPTFISPAELSAARRTELDLYQSLEKLSDILVDSRVPYLFTSTASSTYIFRLTPSADDFFEDFDIRNTVFVGNATDSTGAFASSATFKFTERGRNKGVAVQLQVDPAIVRAHFEECKSHNPPKLFSIMLSAVERFDYASLDHSLIFAGSKSRKISPIMVIAKLSESLSGNNVVTYSSEADQLFKTREGKRYHGVRRYECVFLDYNMNDGQGGWSNKGCRTKPSYAAHADGATVNCECDHLTPFSFFFYLCSTLFDLETDGPAPPLMDSFMAVEPRIFTAISLIISVVMILAVLMHMIISWKLFRKRLALAITPRNFARLNAVFSLLASNITLLVANALVESESSDACLAVAFLSHYLLLSSFFWLVAETYFLVRLILGIDVNSRILNDTYDGLRRKVALLTWGIPMVFPLISMLSHIEAISDDFGGSAYGSKTLWCWIDPLHTGFFLGVFVVPISFIALLNIGVLAYFLYMRRKAREAAEQFRAIRQGAQTIVGTIFLLGGTWLSAYVMLIVCCNDVAKKIAGVFFLLMNACQGIFVWWVYVSQLRGGWRSVIADFRRIAKGSLNRVQRPERPKLSPGKSKQSVTMAPIGNNQISNEDRTICPPVLSLDHNTALHTDEDGSPVTEGMADEIPMQPVLPAGQSDVDSTSGNSNPASRTERLI